METEENNEKLRSNLEMEAKRKLECRMKYLKKKKEKQKE